MADSNVEDKVKDIIVEQLGVEREKLTSEASFMEDLGADSLDTVAAVSILRSALFSLFSARGLGE